MSQDLKAFHLLRFPLFVLVVYIHTMDWNLHNSGPFAWKLYDNIRILISGIIGHAAVPTFFIISGYLFFLSKDTFDFETYLSKLKRRFTTLFVPYIIWNSIYILI